jgi:hypothetical protein
MNFSEQKLTDCYESHLATAGAFPAEVREVSALIGVHDVFRMIEGPHSPGVHETIQHLLSPALRAGLRRWFHHFGDDLDRAAIEFRNHLSQLAGERLEA